MRTNSNSLPFAHQLFRCGKPQKKEELKTLFFLIELVVLGSVLSGCYRVTSRTDVIGDYELKVGQNSINLELLSDQSFKETINWTSGKVESRAGKWYWRPGWVTFDQLWIPQAFAPDYIKHADADADSKQPRYTEPGLWSVSAERDWGTVVLTIFPDADVNFRMVAHSSR